MKGDVEAFEVLEYGRAPRNGSTRFFPSQFEDEVGFRVYQMPGPCPPIRAELEACRFQTSLHFSPEGRHAAVFAQTGHASSRFRQTEPAHCPGSWVSGAWPHGSRSGRQDPASFLSCLVKGDSCLSRAGSAKSTAVMVAFSSGSTSNETGW